MRGAKAQQRRGNCQCHRAMRRGLGCNLILNHIHCRNQIDTHNPKTPNPNQIRTETVRGRWRTETARGGAARSPLKSTRQRDNRRGRTPFPFPQHSTQPRNLHHHHETKSNTHLWQESATEKNEFAGARPLDPKSPLRSSREHLGKTECLDEED